MGEVLRTHKELNEWMRSIELVTEIYRVTKGFPKEETYGLTNQIRRSAVSIPSNLAEGAARSSDKEFSHFISIAIGSIAELETQLIISRNLSYLNVIEFEKINTMLIDIRKMAIGLKKSIDAKR
jgi:four helix bundle protein